MLWFCFSVIYRDLAGKYFCLTGSLCRVGKFFPSGRRLGETRSRPHIVTMEPGNSGGLNECDTYHMLS